MENKFSRFVKCLNMRFFIFISLLFSLSAEAEDKDLSELFDQQGIDGTIVISALHNGQTFIHNESRAKHKFTAASTFKILNTLIALEEKVISGIGDEFEWDGHTYSVSSWNQDQTLQSAFKVSCVWCYQELARLIGAEKYRDYLQTTGYGELNDPFVDTTFWLDGSLVISAIEQIEFLKKVSLRALQFSKSSYETLEKIMLVEQRKDFTLRAKTGLTGGPKPQLGWYVGYVETSNEIWFFATNIDIHDKNDRRQRRKLTQDALKLKGIIE